MAAVDLTFSLKDMLQFGASGAGVLATVTIAWMVRRAGDRQHRENRRAGDVQIKVQQQAAAAGAAGP